MVLSNYLQYNIIIYSLVSGILTGFLFDLYRIVRGTGICKGIAIIEDLLFGILCALVIFTFLLYYNSAFLGVYVYCGIITGLITYLKFASKHILRLEQKILTRASRLFRVIFGYIFYILKIVLCKVLGKNK